MLEAAREFLIELVDGSRRYCRVLQAVRKLLELGALLDAVRESVVELPIEVVRVMAERIG